MKNLLKKLAFVMAFALVLTSLAPAANASAAAEMKINLASKILYLGGSDVSKTKAEYDFYIANKPSNYKSLYTFKWTSSKPSVATVNNSGLTKAVTTGTTTITCTITSKKTGKVVAKPTTAVTVKTNAGAVSIKIKGNPDQRIAKVGEVVDFDRTMTPKTGKGTATDKTKWIFVENSAKAVVKQSNGQVTATTPGTYTIIAYTYQSSSYPLGTDKYGNYVNYTAVSDPITITVTESGAKPTPSPTPTPAPSAPTIVQKSLRSFAITFSTDMSKTLTADNLVIRNYYGISQLIESITFSNNNKTALVTVYNNFDNNSTYTVTYDNTTLSFTTSAGAVSSIEITGVGESGNKVAYGEPAKINYVLRDANGIEVNGGPYAYVDFSLVNDTYTANVSGNEITMWEKGKTATIKAVYHTGEFNSMVQETTFTSNPFTVVCVESVAPELVSIKDFTITNSPDPAGADWNNRTTSISLSDADGSMYLAVRAVNSAGKIEYVRSFLSQDSSKLIIDESTGALIPISTGSYRVICKDANDKAFGYVTVAVTAQRQVTRVELSQKAVTLSNSLSVKDTATVNVILKDQSGKEMPFDSNLVTVTQLSPKNEMGPLSEGSSGETLTLMGAGIKATTYQYKISYSPNISALLTVAVGDGSGDITSYRLSVDNVMTDMKITSSSNSNRYVTLSLNGYNRNNVKVAPVDADITISKPDGKTFTVRTDNGIYKLPVVEGNEKKLQVGRYVATVQKKIGDKAVQPIPFQISDTQPAPTVTFTKTLFEVYQGSYIYPDIIASLKATSTAGADKIEVTIDDSCVAGTIDHGYCDKTGTHYLAVRKLIVKEWFGSNVVDTVITLSSPRTLQINVK